MSAPMYERIGMVANLGDVHRCECGALVLYVDQPVHNRFHSILSSHAWVLAVLKTSHIAAHVHDRYDAVERIDSRHFDNWSTDALAEVVAQMDAAEDNG